MPPDRTDTEWFRDPTTLLDELRRAAPPAARPPEIPGYGQFRELRRGAQGVVFAAVQRSTRRPVAVKVLHDDVFPSEMRRRRFEREIELVAGLQHPHIVRVYDSGATADGRLFFVMEFIDGAPVDAWLRRRRQPSASEVTVLTARDVLQLFAAIARAVGHAHLHGVMHRDLKPSNILIDASGEPHVLDFGVARPATRGPGESALVTETGHFLGTLAYASPEQVRADPASIDVRTDVYSLGVMLYEALTGVLPYPASDSIADVVRSITEIEPVRPSRRVRQPSARDDDRIASSSHRLDDEIDTIVLTALTKDPQRRYPSAGALADDLERYLAGEPIDAKRDSAWYVLSKTLRRHKLRTASALATAVLLLVFAFSMSILYRRTRLEAAKANQIRVFLEDTLGSVGEPSAGDEVTLREVLDEAVHWVKIALADQPEVEASLRTTIGNSYRALGLYDQAEPQLQAALTLHRGLFGDRHPAVAQSLNAIAHLHRDRGQFAEAEELYRRALNLRRELLGPRHPDVTNSLQNLADVLQARGDPGAAEGCLRESLEIRRSLYGERHCDVAMSEFKLAELLHNSRQTDAAVQLHRAALETRLALLHESHPDVARSLLALARTLMDGGGADEAESLLRRYLDIQRRELPDDHPRLRQTREVLAECLTRLGRPDEAATSLSSDVNNTDPAHR